MKTKSGMINAMTLVFMMVILAACGGTAPPVCEDHPGWVEKGGGFFGGDRGSAIYGVGVANVTPTSKISMLRIASDTRARAEIAQSIHSSLEVLTKSYSGHVAENDREHFEELIKQALLSFTKMDLTGAAIVDHHNCPRDRGYYALARMDAEGFTETFKKMNQVSKEVQDVIEQHSKEVFDEMARRSAQTP